MKATLTFDLDDADGRREHLRCCKATEMALALWHMQSRLRDHIDSQLTTNQQWEGAEIVLNRINEIIDEHHINIDELII